MAEGRMLKRNISESRRLAELKTDSARLLWTWIIPFLDSEGRFYASPDMIKGKVVPRILSFTEKNIPKYIEDMASVGLITLYRVDGELLLQYRKFETFQKIVKSREAAPLVGPDKGEIVMTESRSNPDEVVSKSRLPFPNLREVNLREEKRKETPPKTKHLDSVFLTVDEHQKLLSLLSQKGLEAAIEKLDYSITVKSGKYLDHYKTILNWHKRGFLTPQTQNGGNGGNGTKPAPSPAPPQQIYTVCHKCKKEVLIADCFDDNCIHCAPRLTPAALKILTAGLGAGKKTHQQQPEPDVNPNDIPFD